MENNHHDNHNTEQKPVAFNVPLILATVTIFIIVMFLSLCNPKHEHKAAGDHNQHPTEANVEHNTKADITEEHKAEKTSPESEH